MRFLHIVAAMLLACFLAQPVSATSIVTRDELCHNSEETYQLKIAQKAGLFFVSLNSVNEHKKVLLFWQSQGRFVLRIEKPTYEEIYIALTKSKD